MDISGIFDRTAQGISDAIKNAAQATGASFEYLLAAARAESGLNPQAAATTSTARGLYQFVDQTWLATMKHSGASLGLGQYADAIVETAPGHYDVPNPVMRRNILALRENPTANAALAGALTRDNAAILAGRLGRKATDGEVYLAHVLGPTGAARLTALTAASPAAAANAAFPAAAAANHTIFYDQQGRARSVADVYGALVGRYDSARVRQSAAAAPPVGGSMAGAGGAAGADATFSAANSAAATGPASTTVPATVDAQAAQPVPLFNGLFSDRAGPVSQVVQDLWSDPTATAHAPPPSPAAPVTPSSGASLVGAGGQLFQYPSVGGRSPFGP